MVDGEWWSLVMNDDTNEVRITGYVRRWCEVDFEESRRRRSSGWGEVIGF